MTSDGEEIAALLRDDDSQVRVIFSTYQSLEHITAAQFEHNAPPFDLAIMDEAHRTTGVDRRASGISNDAGFQSVHRDDRLKSRRRLYMTATPRIYKESSVRKLRARGIVTVDMGDLDIYGPELHNLTFKEAVNAGILSDYRVIVLGVHENLVTPGIRRGLVSLSEEQDLKGGRPMILREEDMTRVMGTSFAINGIVEGKAIDKPGQKRASASATSACPYPSNPAGTSPALSPQARPATNPSARCCGHFRRTMGALPRSPSASFSLTPPASTGRETGTPTAPNRSCSISRT